MPRTIVGCVYMPVYVWWMCMCVVYMYKTYGQIHKNTMCVYVYVARMYACIFCKRGSMKGSMLIHTRHNSNAIDLGHG